MGEKITEELLRRRSEHNDGQLCDLREIALHQFDIEKIENLDVYCKKLEILFLQHNQISKIEGVGKLKCLNYLNLALNNIARIENLEGCESLQKLDLTVNFVEDLLDVERLKKNEFLRDLFLIGNPCAKEEGYRSFIIATLPQLKSLDAEDIDRSERIKAMQEYPEIRKRLIEARERKRSAYSNDFNGIAKMTDEDSQINTQKIPTTMDPGIIGDVDINEVIEQKRKDFQTKPVPHTPEARLQTAHDLDLMRNGPPKPPPSPPEPVPVYSAITGRVLQKNQGKWKFSMNIIKNSIVLRVRISKYIDTSLIDVDVQPEYIRVTVKGKVLQLVMGKEVSPDQTLCERSRASGELCVTMLIAENLGIFEVENEVKTIKMEQSAAFKKKFDDIQTGKMEQKPKKLTRRDMMIDLGIAKSYGGKINEITSEIPQNEGTDENFEDDPNVPPLC